MGGNGRFLAARRAADSCTCSHQGQRVRAQAGSGTTAQAGATGVRGGRVRAAHGLPVEGAAQGAIRQCQRGAQALPGMGEGRLLRGDSGRPGLPSTTRWRASPGDGRASTGPCSRRPWRKKPSGPTRRIGEKKGSKRHLLVDGRGVPLSIVVTGANEHDVTPVDQVLQAIMVKRKPTRPPGAASTCVPTPAIEAARRCSIIDSHGYIPHVVSRPKEVAAKRRNPAKKCRGLP